MVNICRYTNVWLACVAVSMKWKCLFFIIVYRSSYGCTASFCYVYEIHLRVPVHFLLSDLKTRSPIQCPLGRLSLSHSVIQMCKSSGFVFQLSISALAVSVSSAWSGDSQSCLYRYSNVLDERDYAWPTRSYSSIAIMYATRFWKCFTWRYTGFWLHWRVDTYKCLRTV